MSLKFNRGAAMKMVAAEVARGIDRSLDMMYEIAYKEAPVRKPSAGDHRSRREGVSATHENFQLESKRRQKKGTVSSVKTFRTLIGQGIDPEDAAKAARFSAKRGTNRAGSFDFVFSGRSSGEETANIAFNPKKGTGVNFKTNQSQAGRFEAAQPRGGNLRSKIHRTPVEIDGAKISGALRSEAPYSYYMEYGFEHVGGKHVQGKPFMRPAKAHLQTNWRSNFRSGA